MWCSYRHIITAATFTKDDVDAAGHTHRSRSCAGTAEAIRQYVLLNMLIRMNPINVLGLVPVTVPVTYDT